MIRLLITALAVLACGAAAAFYLRSETGYVLISFHHWIVETSLLGLIVALVAMLFGAYALLRLLLAGVRLPADRKRVVSGKSVAGRVDLGGGRFLKQKHIMNSIVAF